MVPKGSFRSPGSPLVLRPVFLSLSFARSPPAGAHQRPPVRAPGASRVQLSSSPQSGRSLLMRPPRRRSPAAGVHDRHQPGQSYMPTAAATACAGDTIRAQIADASSVARASHSSARWLAPIGAHLSSRVKSCRVVPSRAESCRIAPRGSNGPARRRRRSGYLRCYSYFYLCLYSVIPSASQLLACRLFAALCYGSALRARIFALVSAIYVFVFVFLNLIWRYCFARASANQNSLVPQSYTSYTLSVSVCFSIFRIVSAAAADSVPASASAPAPAPAPARSCLSLSKL